MNKSNKRTELQLAKNVYVAVKGAEFFVKTSKAEILNLARAIGGMDKLQFRLHNLEDHKSSWLDLYITVKN